MSRPVPPSLPVATADSVTLENCASEPIHIPGRIQSHGVLLAFDPQGVATHVSANAAALLGASVPALDERLQDHHFEATAAIHETLRTTLAPATDDELHQGNVPVQLGGRAFELIVHRSGDSIVAEFELQPAPGDVVSDFATKAHRAMDKLKRQGSIDGLLGLAVTAVRQLTGFDRVMAYRFRHDDSGEVVAEDKVDALEPFLARRYPASDIPAQARRLYVVSTLRLIVDVRSEPVAVLAANAALAPLDMSHGVLRSVSPVHIEYLRNMGVGASMSISIVVNGRLWGMLACHHRSALQVPYSVRMACDVLAQVLAANVQSLEARERAQHAAASAALHARLIEAVLHADDPVPVLNAMAPTLADAFEGHAVVVVQAGRLHLHGAIAPEAGQRLARWLTGRQGTQDGVLDIHAAAQLPPDVAQAIAPLCGMLALRFDDEGDGWLALLRKEQVETIHWGGKPEKEYTSGPLGPRLTPRGSFDVWKEVVRGTSVPWSAEQHAQAVQLRDELMRASAGRMAEISRARTQLFAMLGHDLRDPLQSISMAAKVLELGAGAGAKGNRISQRIQSSSSRMARLIGQVLDASRLQQGMGLQLQTGMADLVRVLEDVIDESRVAYPGVAIDHRTPATLRATVDADRMAQLFSNLLSNARHHGTPGEPVAVHLQADGGHLVLEVRNAAPPISDELVPQLFTAFKRQHRPNARNKGGLGLGLHIAQAIVAAHGGHLDYRYDVTQVVFVARLPLGDADPDSAAKGDTDTGAG